MNTVPDPLKDLTKLLGPEALANINEWNTEIANARTVLEELSTSLAIRELRKLAQIIGTAATDSLKTVDPSNIGKIAKLQALAVVPDIFEKVRRVTESRLVASLENIENTLDNLD